MTPSKNNQWHSTKFPHKGQSRFSQTMGEPLEKCKQYTSWQHFTGNSTSTSLQIAGFQQRVQTAQWGNLIFEETKQRIDSDGKFFCNWTKASTGKTLQNCVQISPVICISVKCINFIAYDSGIPKQNYSQVKKIVQLITECSGS